MSTETHDESMSESLHAYVLPAAKAFLAGGYDLENLVHKMYFLSHLPSIRAWADAVLAAGAVRATIEQEMRLIARIYLRTYFGGRETTPAWALRSMEVFAYALIERVVRADATKVELVLDIVGGLNEAIVVAGKTATLGIVHVTEAIRESIVYFSDDGSLEDWGIAFAEALAKRVLKDPDAFDHVRFSDPARVLFQRAGYSSRERDSPSFALTRKIGAANLEHSRGLRNAEAAGCLCKGFSNSLNNADLVSACFKTQQQRWERNSRLLWTLPCKGSTPIHKRSRSRSHSSRSSAAAQLSSFACASGHPLRSRCRRPRPPRFGTRKCRIDRVSFFALPVCRS